MARPSSVDGSARFGLRAVILGLLLLAGAAASKAQAPARGELTGTVVQADDVLPGTTVTITSSAIPTGLRSTVTDTQGRYAFRQLPEGAYEVTFALQGIKRLIVEGVAVPAGTRMGLTGTMIPGPIEERLIVASNAVSLGAADIAEPTANPDVAAGASAASDPVAPQRLVTVMPRYPRDAPRGTAGTVSVMFSVDATGRPVNVEPAPEWDVIGLRDVDGVLSAALPPGEDFRAAAVDAVTQWMYTPPMEGDVTLLVQFTFLAERRVRFVAQRIVEPVRPRPTGAFVVGTSR